MNDPKATITHEYIQTFENPYAQLAYDGVKLIIALSPFLAVFVILVVGAFRSEGMTLDEKKKDDDFTVPGHSS